LAARAERRHRYSPIRYADPNNQEGALWTFT
jgi:hypothetical protein